MSKRTTSLLWTTLAAAIFGPLISALMVPVDNNCAMAQGASYVRQNNPVCRQSLQLAVFTLVDAGVGVQDDQETSPASYMYPGRTIYTEDQYVAVYRDGGTPHYERLAFANSTTPSATAQWIEVAGGTIVPVLGAGEQVGVGRVLDNDGAYYFQVGDSPLDRGRMRIEGQRIDSVLAELNFKGGLTGNATLTIATQTSGAVVIADVQAGAGTDLILGAGASRAWWIDNSTGYFGSTTSPSYAIDAGFDQNAATQVASRNVNVHATATAGFVMETDGGNSLIFRTSTLHATTPDATVYFDNGGGDHVFFGAAESVRINNEGVINVWNKADPAPVVVNGGLYYNTTDSLFYAGIAGAWQPLAWGGGFWAVTNETNNRVITSLGAGLGGNAEANMTFDGATLTAQNAANTKVFDVLADSVTSANAASISADGLTSGTALILESTSTAGTAGGASVMLEIVRSGANLGLAHTAYGLSSVVTNTQITSGTNVAAYLSASGAPTANYGMIVAAGSVGIGTVTPGRLLTVASTGSGTVGPILRLEHLNSAAGDAAWIEYYDGGSARAVLALTTIAGGHATWNFLDQVGGSVSRMFISETGLVGVNTVIPTALLHVSKAASGVLGPTIRLENTSGATNDKARIDFYDATTERAALEWNVIAGGNATWNFLSTNGADASRIFIDGTGQVGIGTLTPGYVLEVVGGVATTGGSAGFNMHNRATDALSMQWYSPTAGDLRLYDHVAGADRWIVDSSGDLYPGSVTAADVGDTTNKIMDVYIGNDIKDVRLIHADQGTAPTCSCSGPWGTTGAGGASCVVGSASRSMRGSIAVVVGNAGGAGRYQCVITYVDSFDAVTGNIGARVPIVQGFEQGSNAMIKNTTINIYDYQNTTFDFVVNWHAGAPIADDVGSIFYFVYQVMG